MVRINKFLASCKLGSRRKVEELISQKLVYINDELCTDFSTYVNPETDIVKVGKKIIKYDNQKIFILINKPVHYIVSMKDEFNRKTIYSLLPDFAQNLHPIGRLDYDSEGLLILTNDGDITHKILHPSYKVDKTYKVIVKGKIEIPHIQKLRNGVKIDNYTTQPAKVFLNHSSDDKSELRIIIKEGKNRQIRKMLESIGFEVVSLKRLQIGNIKLEKMPVGTWRFLKDSEILYLLKQTHTKINHTQKDI
jgi:23S rRNA pseudouridine2605 synthase